MIVLESLRRGWALLLLVTIPVAAGVALYAESLSDEFQATAVVSYAPRLDAQVGADVVRLVVPKYQIYVLSDATVRRAAREVGVSKSEIEDGLTAAVSTDTSNLEITVNGENRREVARAANALADEAVTFSDGDRLLVGTVVARAAAPTSPSGPPRRLLEIAGLLAALVVGVGVVLVVDRLRPIVRSAADVGAATRLRVLGALPRARALRAPRQAIGSARVGSAIRNLRTQLDHAAVRNGEARGYVLVVTSASRHQGKTTVASSLAIASARVGQRVLLVDGHLEHPDLAAVFGVPSSPGVSDALRGDALDEERIGREVMQNLSVMPSAPDADAGDRLASGMQRLLTWGARRFELVVVDAPPLLGNDSAQKLATLADGVVLVVSRGTREPLVESAMGILRALDANVIGAVANDVRETEQAGAPV